MSGGRTVKGRDGEVRLRVNFGSQGRPGGQVEVNYLTVMLPSKPIRLHQD